MTSLTEGMEIISVTLNMGVFINTVVVDVYNKLIEQQIR